MMRSCGKENTNMYKNRSGIRMNSKLFEKIRLRVFLEDRKLLSGKNNPMYGTHFIWITNDNTKENKRWEINKEIPEEMQQNGWRFGVHRSKLKYKRHMKSYFMIKNEKLKKTKHIYSKEELTEDMIKDGWEFGRLMSEKNKLSRKKREKYYTIDGITL